MVNKIFHLVSVLRNVRFYSSLGNLVIQLEFHPGSQQPLQRHLIRYSLGFLQNCIKNKKRKARSLQHIALHNEKLWFIFLFFMLYSYSAPSNMILQECQKLIPSFLCMWLSVRLSNIQSSKSYFMCLLTSVMLAFITVKALVYRIKCLSVKACGLSPGIYQHREYLSTFLFLNFLRKTAS